MERMIVTTFGTDAEAQRGVSALKDLNASGDITLYGVVVLGKDVSDRSLCGWGRARLWKARRRTVD